MAPKSERFRKLESELEDLKKWLELGLVPKSDLKRHKDEIREIEKKISEEIERLEIIRQSGQAEEFVAPKRQNKIAYSDTPTASDLDIGQEEFEEDSFSYETESSETEQSTSGSLDSESASTTGEESETEDWQEDPFHEKNRWKKRDIVDPDADIW